MNTKKVYSFVLINGILDILMAILHKFIGWSWWSQYNINIEYVYFAILYGCIRILQINKSIVSLSYFVEALYFICEKDAKYTFLICILLSIITY